MRKQRALRMTLAGAALALAAGCLAVKPQPIASWFITPTGAGTIAGATGQLGETRLAFVTVRAPYDTKQFAVLRADGSVAFDPYNQFAAAPSALIKGVALDVLNGSGAFSRVQSSVTTADVRDAIELVVDELALDCRTAKERTATVRLTLTHVHNRRVVASGTGAARVAATGGNYSAAFGKALEEAMRQALGPLMKEATARAQEAERAAKREKEEKAARR